MCILAAYLPWSFSVGIKRRLAEAVDEEPRVAEATTPTEYGGPRGGVRRRLEAQQPTPTHRAQGPLFDVLKRDWALGVIHSGQVQEYALNAARQGAVGMDVVGDIGSAGARPQNMFRALKSLMGIPVGAPSLAWFEVPLKSGKKVAHPFLLPHEFFASYYRECKDKFLRSILGHPEAPAHFWESMATSSFVQKHPHLHKDNWSKTIPLGMHGDAGAFSKQDSLYILSWNSLLGGGTTVQKRFLFTVVRKKDMTGDTLNAMLDILSWSFNVLLNGLAPKSDYYGKSLHGEYEYLADGYRGCLSQVRGDWAFYTEVFKFPQWNGAERMCWQCKASSIIPNLAWSDFSETAGWRATRWTHEAYLSSNRARDMMVPVILAKVVGFRLECIMVDVLHTVDLGIAAHIIGNVFWVLVILRSVFGGGAMADKAKLLQQNLTKWYKSNRVTTQLQGTLTAERIRTSGGWPKLKAKGAATRHLAGFALFLVQTYCGASEEDRCMLGVCQLLVRFYDILQSESQFMRSSAKQEIAKLGRNLALLYNKLSLMAIHSGAKLWKTSPKLHIFVHMCEWQVAEFSNPRYWWTYPDEDLVRIMVEIAKTVHPLTLAMNCLFKWLHVSFDC